ncbi:Peroxisomal targeting signal receptor [Hypsizygus marmoreus]|uniref:Peroxisomal targeting signal receptor n=1 Tax=Hypsizygus marmoreus TaxID=39966 RepID=A0A369JVC5_HYPMA|nr:Peroxisomal targeting signal receptor [Hypsizygus marmoreus]
MALSMLAGGADCGPSNPLQGLSKRFDQDRGAQQDHFGAGRAGSSKEAFRTHAGPASPDQDAARFFSSNVPQAPHLSMGSVYDVSALRAALPPQMQMPAQVPQQQANPLGNWALDFAQQQPIHGPQLTPTQSSEMGLSHSAVMANVNAPHAAHPVIPQGNLHWNPTLSGQAMSIMPSFSPMQTQVQRPVVDPQISWDNEFTTHEMVSQISSIPTVQQHEQITRQGPQDSDELSRTAALLLEHVRNEQNPKFQNSQFLGLMKKLRDRDVIVEGNQMVENDGQRTSSDVKGKGKASDGLPWPASKWPIDGRHTMETSFADTARHELNTLSEGARLEEDANDAYFRQDNAEYMQWNEMEAPAANHESRHHNADATSWDRLQNDWDQFEATAAGIKPVNNYQFQDNNPYLVGDSSRTRQHSIHQSLNESVLQLEAAVQRDMNNASAWFELGVKQQENEREYKALQALKRAVELDPSHLPTWLALAVSHTNEGNRIGTYDAIYQWVDRNGRYEPAVQQFHAQKPTNSSASIMERYTQLIDTLITMARSDTSGEVDADIQIALAVLLNSNEDYEKAQDCFRTALAVRPEDWLLYNRVGATMANNGRAEEALQYYYQALDLHPGYIRARFNLGISCINLRRYEEAAQHILDALVLQDNDGIKDSAGLNEKRGVTSTALWDSLKTTCLHMQRVDLATICDRKDLEAFRLNFHM